MIAITKKISNERGTIRFVSVADSSIALFDVPKGMVADFCDLPESTYACCYALVGFQSRTGKPEVYFGQSAGNVSQRLNRHRTDRPFWERAFIVVSRCDEWNRTDVEVLEQMCIEAARQSRRYFVHNDKNGSKFTGSGVGHTTQVQRFHAVAHLFASIYPSFFAPDLFSVAGGSPRRESPETRHPLKKSLRDSSSTVAYRSAPQKPGPARPVSAPMRGATSPSVHQESPCVSFQAGSARRSKNVVSDSHAGSGDVVLTLSGPFASATARMTRDGFVVLKGSKCRKTCVRSMRSGRIPSERRRLKQSAVLRPSGASLVFNEDWVFSSASTAAEVVLGRSANGRICWKTPSGGTLNMLFSD